jgi:hypothetical protein
MIIGYTAGVLDLFHIGNMTLLKNAKGFCDKFAEEGIKIIYFHEFFKGICSPFLTRFKSIGSAFSISHSDL